MLTPRSATGSIAKSELAPGRRDPACNAPVEKLTVHLPPAFVKDLLIDPSTRNVTDIGHEVVAVGSRSQGKAEKFCTDNGIASAKAYGSYETLVRDPNVDIIYVSSPHSEHFPNTMLCLDANKHVLCEKAFTVNAAQATLLCETAESKGLFLMEAQWTRFFPLSTAVRAACARGELGKIWRVSADCSFGSEVETAFPDEHRMVNPALAGGCLLDLGLYACLWNFQILYHLASPPVEPTVASSCIRYPPTGVDQLTDILLGFPSASGVARSNFRVAANPDGHFSAGPAIKIEGSHGTILVPGPAYRPTSWTKVGRFPGAGGEAGDACKAPGPLVEVHEEEIPGGGHGMFWEADECARCVRDGKLESEVMPHEESVAMMRVFDRVREAQGLKYPDNIESTTWNRARWMPMIL